MSLKHVTRHGALEHHLFADVALYEVKETTPEKLTEQLQEAQMAAEPEG